MKAFEDLSPLDVPPGRCQLQAMSDLFKFAADMAAQGGGRLPPVEKWQPAYCGEMDMVIRADGRWDHEGTPIGRAPLVRLFSTILRREGDDYFLVTPAEKIKIKVEDAPFVAVILDLEPGKTPETQRLKFRTNVGDEVIAGADFPIRFGEGDASDIPYVMVRAGLEAKLNRPVYYQLAEYVVEHDGKMGVWSDGQFFAFPKES